MLDATAVQKLGSKSVGVDAEKVKERVGQLYKDAGSKEKEAVLELSGAAKTTAYRTINTGNLNIRLAVALAQVLNVNPRYVTGTEDERGVCSDKILNSFLAEQGFAEYEAAIEPAKKKGRAKAEPKKAKEAKEAKAAADSSAKKSPRRKKSESGAGTSEKEIEERFDSQVRDVLEQTVVEYYEENGVPAEGAPELALIAETGDAATVAPAVVEIVPSEDPTTSPETQQFIDAMSEDEMTLLLKAAILRAKAGIPGAVEAVGALKRLLLSVR